LTSPAVDVVIVGYRSVGFLEPAVASVSHDETVGALILVDNASGDGTADLGRKLGMQVVETEENLGFARAVNIGVRLSSAPYVLLLNPDARMLPGALARLAETLDRLPQAAMASALLRFTDGSYANGCRHFSTLANRILPDMPLANRLAAARAEYDDSLYERDEPIQAVDWLGAAALLVRRSFLDEIGGLDERFFLYSEDEDLGWAARARGYTCVVRLDAPAEHEIGFNTTEWRVSQPRLLAAQRQLFEKWRGPGIARAFDLGVQTAFAAQVAAAALTAPGRLGEQREVAVAARRALAFARVRSKQARMAGAFPPVAADPAGA